MKLRFSISDLLVAIFLVAATISVVSFFNHWRQSYVEREFRTFRKLEKLAELEDGDELTDVQRMFDDLLPVENEIATIVTSNRELSTSDEVFAVAISDSSARFLHFRDGVLVNFTFTTKDMENSLKSLQAPVPQWYIQHGQWLIVGVLIAVVGFLRLVVFRRAKSPRQGPDAESLSVETMEG